MSFDLLYPYGVPSKFGHRELQISIASFRRHATGIGEIYVIGCDPGPVNATHIPYEQTARNKEAAIAEVLCYGMQVIPFLSREVVLMCDDYVATQTFEIEEFRAPAGPSLRALADKRPKANYSQALRDTSRYLLSKELSEIHFDYHMPMIVDRYKWVALEEHWKASRARPFGMVCKSLYGNIYGVEPQYQPDHKANKDSITIDEIYDAALSRKVISYGDRCAQLVFNLFGEYL